MKRFFIITLLAFTVGIFAQCGDEAPATETPQPCANACAAAGVPTKAELKELRKAYKALPKGSKERKKAYKAYKTAKKAYKAAKK